MAANRSRRRAIASSSAPAPRQMFDLYGLGMGRIQFASQPVNYPTEYRDTTYRANSDVQGLGFVTRIVPTCNHDASSKVSDLGMAA